MKISFNLNYVRTSTTFNESDLFTIGLYLQITSHDGQYPTERDIVSFIKWRLQDVDPKSSITPKNQFLSLYRSKSISYIKVMVKY